MPVTLTLPDSYAYAGVAILSTFWLSIWQTSKVGHARAKAGIKYPQAYAEAAQAAASVDAMKFNCVQRAHQNTLESLPTVIVSTAIAATRYPIFAAVACGIWVFARVMYTIGYSTGEPSKRNWYKSSMIGNSSTVALLLTATYTAVKAVL
ncbi:membrane-associated proteins in eicosanoid and glutathione metabolism [Abortiporus biennis]|nr:membrane-associated proteins in eicosanoid and glutathione metabolism [Abortiporus biennis]